jgi:diguanylate cyclase (GGDEF)-like protein
MNVYMVIPLVATMAYIPLLATTLSTRPLRKQHKLFAVFLGAAILWSLSDLLLRSDFCPQYNLFLGKIIMITFTLMAVQFITFTRSFVPPVAAGQRYWIPVAYATLAAVIAVAILGYLPEGIVFSEGRHYPSYGRWVLVLAIPLLTLSFRMAYVLWKQLKIQRNPVQYNQLFSLLVSLFVLIAFALLALLPWGREYPLSHLGNVIVACILSYATIRHRLVDIRFVLRRGMTWISTGLIGVAGYVILLVLLRFVFHFELDVTATLAVTAAALVAAILIYRSKGLLAEAMGKAFERQSYDYRLKLSDFAQKIHNVFSLGEQGGELLSLLTMAVGCGKAALLFLEAGSQDFVAQLAQPDGEGNPLTRLRLKGNSPIVEYLERERKPLTRENLSVLPEFSSLWEQEKETIRAGEIELFMPLISRDRLIGILVLDRNQSGRYSLADFHLLEDITGQVAVSMEKEYLREQLRQREEELSVINSSSTIITSSLDIREIYDSFVMELKKVVDVSWASIVLIEGSEIHLLAIFSEIGSAWQTGERLPLKGSATEWVAGHREPMVEPDLVLGSRFSTAKYHLKQGVRSIAYLPLMVKGEVIGTLIVASRYPDVYSQRHLALLEQLASQIAMPIENSRLYAKAEQEARVDELTGLLNRRALDEMITSEIGRHSRYGGVFSMVILDLDSFKAYNDHYGHLAGDKILAQVGSIMNRAIRGADQAFRYGGDEFAIVLPQTSVRDTFQVAERVRKKIASEVKAGYISLTASLGLASWPADGMGPNELIAAADVALYQAKRGGGNQSFRSSGAMLMSDGMTAVPETVEEDSATMGTVYALAATVDAKEHYPGGHSKKVSEYSLALGEAIGLEPVEINKLSTCALLHDVGKIGISDEILNKESELTAEEWETIKLHPQLGATIAGHARQLAPCIPGILHHHERYDGTGYPKGLKGEEIPLEARILAIADAFAAMTSERPFSPALSHEEALAEMRRGAGTQFDPQLVEVFLSLIQKAAPIAVTDKEKI